MTADGKDDCSAASWAESTAAWKVVHSAEQTVGYSVVHLVALSAVNWAAYSVEQKAATKAV